MKKQVVLVVFVCFLLLFSLSFVSAGFFDWFKNLFGGGDDVQMAPGDVLYVLSGAGEVVFNGNYVDSGIIADEHIRLDKEGDSSKVIQFYNGSWVAWELPQPISYMMQRYSIDDDGDAEKRADVFPWDSF